MRPKLLPNEGVSSYHNDSDARYCDNNCRMEKEQRLCHKCLEYFPPNKQGSKWGEKDSCYWYCSEKCRHSKEDWCSIM